ncbi:MAG TPA: PRC-barrel domain-containing protein [Hyphomicrobiaceae bacterium]|jgi:sporulation protein YlmC with PRC-barrel domain|nr:PRC-barrel domain-containing protein [Hyphomicrobiaceae bacterium]
MRTALLGLTTGLLLAGTSLVFAQTTPAPTPEPPPAAKPTEPPATKPTDPPAAKTTGAQQMWYSRQADEMRASKLIGTRVLNSANETVGDVNEIVLTKDGKVAAVILGIGGFLGIGEREVAVNFNSIAMTRDQNNNLVLTVNATKDSLTAAPAWRWDEGTKK